MLVKQIKSNQIKTCNDSSIARDWIVCACECRRHVRRCMCVCVCVCICQKGLNGRLYTCGQEYISSYVRLMWAIWVSILTHRAVEDVLCLLEEKRRFLSLSWRRPRKSFWTGRPLRDVGDRSGQGTQQWGVTLLGRQLLWPCWCGCWLWWVALFFRTCLAHHWSSGWGEVVWPTQVSSDVDRTAPFLLSNKLVTFDLRPESLENVWKFKKFVRSPLNWEEGSCAGNFAPKNFPTACCQSKSLFLLRSPDQMNLSFRQFAILFFKYIYFGKTLAITHTEVKRLPISPNSRDHHFFDGMLKWSSKRVSCRSNTRFWAFVQHVIAITSTCTEYASFRAPDEKKNIRNRKGVKSPLYELEESCATQLFVTKVE